MPPTLAVSGSRTYRHPHAVTRLVRAAARKYPALHLIHGNARGVDQTARDAALSLRLRVTAYPADWDAHGKMAGFLRNATLVADCDHLIAFWDGYSRGTAHAISLAAKAGKLRQVFGPTGEPMSSLEVAARAATDIYETSANLARAVQRGNDFSTRTT
jgi:YspA, cpYpsA-related SLOG family